MRSLPPAGTLAGVMRHNRARYHWAVKLHKSEEDDSFKVDITQHANNNHSRDLWNELHQLQSANKPVPNTIDGLSNNAKIVNNFANKYSELYKSVPSSASELEVLQECISGDLTKCSISDLTQTLCYADIEKSILKPKHWKSHGPRGTDSNNFILCSRKFQILLSLLVSSRFVHRKLLPACLKQSFVVSRKTSVEIFQ